MAKKSISIDCQACMNQTSVSGQNAELVTYCPICGDPVVRSYDDEDEDDYDEEDDLRSFDPDDEE